MVRYLCVWEGGLEYLTFDIFLHAKFEKKIIVNQICTPIIFKNPLKTCFFIKKYTFTICVGCVWIVIYISYSKNKLLMEYYRLLVYKKIIF